MGLLLFVLGSDLWQGTRTPSWT
eukprot:COSAG01_NODE_71508_length_255_cov_1.666667_1_plen_22_part_01